MPLETFNQIQTSCVLLMCPKICPFKIRENVKKKFFTSLGAIKISQSKYKFISNSSSPLRYVYAMLDPQQFLTCR